MQVSQAFAFWQNASHDDIAKTKRRVLRELDQSAHAASQEFKWAVTRRVFDAAELQSEMV